MKEEINVYNIPEETCLFHYTSIYVAKRIIYNRQLRFSALYRQNDIKESFRPINLDTYPASLLALGLKWKLPNGENDLNAYEKFYKIIESYRQISFSMDIPNPICRGYELDNMWGLYAERGNGACLVFDKQKLLDKLPPNSANTHGAIKYLKRYDNTIRATLPKEKLEIEDLSAYIADHAEEIFFKKSLLWEHEQEYRIIKDCHNKPFNDHEYLDIGDALEYVILYVPQISEHSSNIHISTEQSMECMSKLCKRHNVKLLFLVDINGRHLIDSVDWDLLNIS